MVGCWSWLASQSGRYCRCWLLDGGMASDNAEIGDNSGQSLRNCKEMTDVSDGRVKCPDPQYLKQATWRKIATHFRRIATEIKTNCTGWMENVRIASSFWGAHFSALALPPSLHNFQDHKVILMQPFRERTSPPSVHADTVIFRSTQSNNPKSKLTDLTSTYTLKYR